MVSPITGIWCIWAAEPTGGAALVICEATSVTAQGRISPGDLGIWKDEHIPMLKQITTFIESQNSFAGVQLAHAGRKASHAAPWEGGKALTGQESWQTVAPSAIAFTENEPEPKELSIAEIEQLITDFKNAATRALKAGFKVIEIHGAHGYLINEFLSPLSNTRMDNYGGAFENRIRFLVEIVRAVRGVWPAELPLFVRISATDWADGGWTEEDSIKLAGVLKNEGVDLMDCSSGGNIAKVKIPVGPLYQVPFAEGVKTTGILTGAVGLITTPQEANDIIVQSKADVVLLAREMLRDPYFALRAAYELKADINWPLQYERAKKK